jgi:EAL domain-containing protein (putative c-di-GMP-specific phosphodiesterase class I)
VLDDSVVAGLDRDRRSATIARIAAAAGRDAGLTIGAKGVADAEQAAALLRLGVERGQGDAFGARLCPQTIARLLASGAPLAPRAAAAGDPVVGR